MNKNLDGKKISSLLYEELRNYIKEKNILPKIVDISIGNDFGSLMYSKMKKRKIEKELGFKVESVHFNKIEHNELIEYIKNLNDDKNINGIMLQLPLPKNLKDKERNILDTIDVNKDIDGLTSTSLGKLFVGKETFIPCTPKGVITLLKCYNVDLNGKNICIINRSNIVGKTLEQLFIKENATTTLCHSYTKELKNITKKADILIVAINNKKYITKDYIKKNAIIIDIGINKENDKVVGDVDYNKVYSKASLITPPIGSVGPMTICMLCYNIALSIYGNEIEKVLETGINKIRTNK